ncbi:MAG TPA: TolC family protein [Bryobacteraceae bacterium]|nr:TolC family protein [Bryobacteraceae bacterium]
MRNTLTTPVSGALAILAAITVPFYGQEVKPAPALPSPLQSEAQAGRPLTLSDLEKMALEKNPTLGQAAAELRAAAARAKQAGLYPNPTIGVTGDEIARGPIIRGGEMGGFFEQRIVTGGKLGLSRRIAEQEQRVSEAVAGGQKQRVLNAVRSLYFQALGEQRLVDLRIRLARIARDVIRTSQELGNVGQADRPDILAAEIEAQRLELGLTSAQNARERTWRQLAAIVNNPSLKPTLLEGDLEAVPKLDLAAALQTIYSESPDLRAAQAGISRSELAVRRAQREPIPDVAVRGGVRNNRELLEQGPGGTLRPVGVEGFFDVGVQIPIFNRNQGAVAAARAEAERSRLEVERTKLALGSRFAEVYREYQDSLVTIERYRTQMIPKAQQAYELYLNSFRQMAAAYPQVLISQRNLFQLQEDYISALVAAWQRAIEIQGLLLTGGTEFSSESTMPRTTRHMQSSGGSREGQQ